MYAFICAEASLRHYTHICNIDCRCCRVPYTRLQSNDQVIVKNIQSQVGSTCKTHEPEARRLEVACSSSSSSQAHSASISSEVQSSGDRSSDWAAHMIKSRCSSIKLESVVDPNVCFYRCRGVARQVHLFESCSKQTLKCCRTFPKKIFKRHQ